MQCIRVEGANIIHIWFPRLDELPRSARSSKANEGPMWDNKGPSGISPLLPIIQIDTEILSPLYFTWKFLWKIEVQLKFPRLLAGWSLCIHRQPSCFSFGCIICLPEVYFTWPGQYLTSRRTGIRLKNREKYAEVLCVTYK